MDAVLLARIQFALTIGFHYIFPPITIGMAWIIVAMLHRAGRSSDALDLQVARFWIKVFALSFAVGVATGITMEFQFGTNWADYSRFVGDIFGAPLAAEGILAFFLESSFLGVLLFGEKKVSPRCYRFAALMVAIGSTLSGFWIIAANSWQQTPAGFEMVDGRPRLTSFIDAVFNPSTLPRFCHAIDGALITGSFFVVGLSAWLLLRRRHVEFARRSAAIALVVGLVASAAQIGLGHWHAVQVARDQPAKLAAFEGLWETQRNAPLTLVGIPDAEGEQTRHAIGIPGLLSLLVGLSTETEVKGLKEFRPEDRPPLFLPFWSWRAMVGLGFYFVAFSALGVFLWWRRRLVDFKPYQYLALITIPLPIITNELGWISAEVGRQPWVVQGLLRTAQAHSPLVPAGQIVFSILLLCAVYALLFAVWIYVLRRKLLRGPDQVAPVDQATAAAAVTP
ncbi:MAG: cytochrome ubiquinol oxidase subunit I [Deltaproteobacteria bacterium]|nr:cytochrome ubiquinol oxidase subunit I [Deltaproteobacteria bacterium]